MDLDALRGYAEDALRHGRDSSAYLAPRANRFFRDHTDLTSLALLAIIGYLSLLILTQSARWATSITRSVFRLTYLAAFALALFYVSQRGLSESLGDANAIFDRVRDATQGKLRGFF